MKKIASSIAFSFILIFGLFALPVGASEYELTPVEEDGEVESLALFIPDRCIYAHKVTKLGSGWYVTSGSATYFLDKKAKHGLWNPKVGKDIEVMMSKGLVAGWKVL